MILTFAIEWRHYENSTPSPCLTFSWSNIANVIIWEMVRTSIKVRHTPFKVFYFCYEMCHFESSTPWHLHTLSRTNISNVNISEVARELAQKCQIQLLSVFIFAIGRRHCKRRTLWPWPTFSRLKLWMVTISCFWQICLHLYATAVELVLLYY